MGVLYLTGRGVPKDYSEALRWSLLAAKHGSAFAQCNLGTMYELGDGVEKNPRLAESWYRRAASNDYPEAEYRLGRLLAEKSGGNAIEAAGWFRRTADHGDRRAQFSIGLMYAKGRGVTQSYEEAAAAFHSHSRQPGGTAIAFLAPLFCGPC